MTVCVNLATNRNAAKTTPSAQVTQHATPSRASVWKSIRVRATKAVWRGEFVWNRPAQIDAPTPIRAEAMKSVAQTAGAALRPHAMTQTHVLGTRFATLAVA